MQNKPLTSLALGLLMASACNAQEIKSESDEFHSSSYTVGDEFLIRCFYGNNIAASLLLTSRLDDVTEVSNQVYLDQVRSVSDQFNEKFLTRARRIINGDNDEEMQKNSLVVLDYCEEVLSKEKSPVIQSLEAATANIARKTALEVE